MVAAARILGALFAWGAASADAQGTVLVGTDANFDEEIEKYKDGILVEFYAPWCGHCKKLAPEYEKAARQLQDKESKYKLMKVDATVEKKIAGEAGVKGYPTLKWYQGKDSAVEYDGPREANGIVEWITMITGPVVAEGAPGADVVGATVTLYDGEISSFFEAEAKKNRKAAKWFFVKDSSAKKVVIKHPAEDEIVSTEAVKDAAALSEFFKKNELPIVGEINGETFSKYVGRTGFGLIWCLFPMDESNKEDALTTMVAQKRPLMNGIAQGLKAAKLDYSVTYTNTAEFKQALEGMFGVKEFPKFVVQKKAGDKKYFIMDEKDIVEPEAVVDYVKKVESGEIKAELKSEDAPEEPQPTDAVKVVVATTLEQKVFTEDKDVLLEVYAPWCGHCKKLEPEYNKVAQKVDKEGFAEKITIAKMDGTTNDSPVDSIDWSGFPTIVFVKKGSKTVEKYDGGRTAKDIWQWLKKNSSYADEIAAKKKEEKEEKKDEKEEL